MIQNSDIQIENIYTKFNEIESIDNTLELRDKGIASYIKEPNMPQGVMIKINPDGSKEKIIINDSFEEIVLEKL